MTPTDHDRRIAEEAADKIVGIAGLALNKSDVLPDILAAIAEAKKPLEEDRARLDWLTGCTTGPRWQSVLYQYDTRPLANGDLRAAIDAARAQEGKP